MIKITFANTSIKQDVLKRTPDVRPWANRLTMRTLPRILIIFSTFLIMTFPVSAKRLAPKPVIPVIVNSVEYSAPDNFIGFIIATDINTHKELWKERIYTISYIPHLEEDVQWVFIRSLSTKNNQLIITNENGDTFSLDLVTRKVTKIKTSLWWRLLHPSNWSR